MTVRKWLFACTAAVFLLTGSTAFSQGNGHGNGNGHGKGHEKHEEDQDQRYYRDHDRGYVHAWYASHANNLPPGLAKKDRLPPGLEKQLVVRGTLPPGLEKKVEPVPVEVERELPPPPPDCSHVFIGGSLVLLNRRTNVVVDIFAVATP